MPEKDVKHPTKPRTAPRQRNYKPKLSGVLKVRTLVWTIHPVINALVRVNNLYHFNKSSECICFFS